MSGQRKGNTSRIHRENQSKRGSPDTGKVDPALLMPWVDIEDGNADKEAEKLIPGPNFYVLIVQEETHKRAL